MYIGLLGIFITWLVNGFSISSNWWKIVLVIMACAFAGKISGLMISGYRLKASFKQLDAYFNAPYSTPIYRPEGVRIETKFL